MKEAKNTEGNAKLSVRWPMHSKASKRLWAKMPTMEVRPATLWEAETRSCSTHRHTCSRVTNVATSEYNSTLRVSAPSCAEKACAYRMKERPQEVLPTRPPTAPTPWLPIPVPPTIPTPPVLAAHAPTPCLPVPTPVPAPASVPVPPAPFPAPSSSALESVGTGEVGADSEVEAESARVESGIEAEIEAGIEAGVELEEGVEVEAEADTEADSEAVE
mmetsp:Transcript_28487/g.64527  ORF Transcript_28487/g.64527 Transcript_28487/m.64527 type:complete len:217 (-) Transcript_28487:131-781(-)